MHVFADVHWTVISPEYLKTGKKLSQSAHSWRTFLTKLGVQERLAVERVDINPKEEVAIHNFNMSIIYHHF